MNKLFKKIAACFTAFVMMFFAVGSVNVFADGNYTITINNKEEGHTYSAYQVFKGDLSGSTLSNIDWGEAVDGNAILTDENLPDTLKDKKSAKEIAEALKDSNSAQFAAVVANHLKADATTYTSTPVTEKETIDGKETDVFKEKYVISIPDTKAGYYFVKDTGKITDGQSATKYILRVVKNTSVNAKTDTPTITKSIIETDESNNENPVDANQVSIGQDVVYELTGTIPDMSNYEQYYYIMHDEMSEGLTFKEINSVKLYDAEGEEQKTLTTSSKDYSTEPSVISTDLPTDKTEFSIIFNNFLQYKNYAGGKVVVRYTATLNENAEIGSTGNPNNVLLEYSNNPNVKGDGVNKPGDNENVTGKTPKDWVITYTTDFEILKTDGTDPLTGAEFTLTGDGVVTTLVKKQEYVKQEDGADLTDKTVYYLLNNGSYTDTAPNGSNNDNYSSTTDKYLLEETVTPITKNTSTAVKSYVGTDGKLKFAGLGVGDYTLEETVVPAGYNKCADVIVHITCQLPTDVTDGTETATWTIKKDNDDKALDHIEIVNKAGSTLPETGGMGTTMLYIAGGILVLGSVIFFMTSRKMRKE